jgi:hypothetical protein
MDLVVHGGAVPTFLLKRLLAATGVSAVAPRPPQMVRLNDARRTPEFAALIPLIEAEKLDWAFVDRNCKLSDFRLIAPGRLSVPGPMSRSASAARCAAQSAGDGSSVGSWRGWGCSY